MTARTDSTKEKGPTPDGDLQKRHTMSGATASTRNLFGLCDCIHSGDAESLRHRLSRCSTDINSVLPCKGVGILHLAVGIEPVLISIQCTELILKHGGNPNLRSEDGMTPVHVAAIWGRLESLRLLVACGGDPGLRDYYGLTAYDYADMEQQYDVLNYLQRNFVDGKHRYDMRVEPSAADNPCRYSLQLERILLSTGHVVAEYGAVSDNKLRDVSVCRKSEMVRVWCEQTSRVNRLYPTILNQTYLLQDESRPWKQGDFTDDTDLQQTTNQMDETKTSYKSCGDFNDTHLQEESADSDVVILNKTRSETDPECNCSCHSDASLIDTQTKRVSVYENFSLPGSPTNIIHQNYNSKTTLRKCNTSSVNKTKKWACKKKCLTKIKTKKQNRSKSNNNEKVNEGLDYKKLNDALAMVQNETNEWLSHSNSSNESDEQLTLDVTFDIPADDTVTKSFTIAERSLIKAVDGTMRLSQRSSGVSTASSGSIALASVQEEYKYEDKEEDVVLIEKRLLVPSVVIAMEEAASEEVSPEASRQSMASSLPASIDYDAGRLRAELTACGFTPGPITDNTKRLYLRKLKNLRRNPVVTTTLQAKTYSIELERSLRNETWFQDLSAFMDLETKVRSDFSNPNNARLWREGSAKTSFTYLLLDPRLTDNLPGKATSQSKHATWTTFVSSIFYVGKGKRSRPYSHLYQALTLWKRDFKTSDDKKVQHILDIWSDHVGVICLHVFQNVIPAEAYTYEAAMIDVLDVCNLRNLRIGNYYGVAAGWPLRDRRMLGLFLLYKAMLIFLSEGERQLLPDDID